MKITIAIVGMAGLVLGTIQNDVHLMILSMNALIISHLIDIRDRLK